MKSWRRVDRRRLQRCGIFDLDEVRYEPSDGRAPQPFYVVEAPDWINVIALTERDDVLLLRQFRFGIDAVTLEIPGGMCDPGEAPLDSAQRELLEETGHASDDWSDLGWVHPNPAVQSNRCHTFLARNARRVAEPSPDGNESFEQVSLPLARIPQIIARGEITHALVVAAFQRLATLRPDGG